MTTDGARPMPRKHAQSTRRKKKPFYVPGPNRKLVKRSRIQEAQGEEMKVEAPDLCTTNLSDQTLPTRSDGYGSEEKKSPKREVASKLG